MTIDLNCDLGELPDMPEAELMPLITSANVACGGHAGDAASMERTLRLAQRHGVACGAHPGYPDRERFGRFPLSMDAEALAASVWAQICELDRIAASVGCAIRHVKPHGALYNTAASNPAVARAIADGVARWSTEALLVGLAGSAMLEVWREQGFRVVAEAFADRAYEPDGSLRPRNLPGALITDASAAAAQAVAIARAGPAQTICIHGDTDNAVAIARAVRAALSTVGIAVAPPR